MNTPEYYLQRALQLAEQGRYCASPNPMVGCVIVKELQIIGEGWHQGPGTDHAEVMALQQAGANAQNAEVYINLEPCCHHGHTPPCVDALIQAGVKQVFAATQDPNPLMTGKGFEKLRQAGISVQTGILSEEAKQLNKAFFHFMQKRRPFVIAKWAMSLDGKTETSGTDDKQISNALSHQQVHLSRCQTDAILVGVNTALKDNPQLTTRLPEHLDIINRHPVRIVLDSRGRSTLNLKLFDSQLPGETIVATTDQSPQSWREQLIASGVEVLILDSNQRNQVCLQHLMKILYEKQIASLLVEGGMKVHQQFLAAGLVDEVQAYIAPVVIGGLERKLELNVRGLEHLEGDYLIRAGVSG